MRFLFKVLLVCANSNLFVSIGGKDVILPHYWRNYWDTGALGNVTIMSFAESFIFHKKYHSEDDSSIKTGFILHQNEICSHSNSYLVWKMFFLFCFLTGVQEFLKEYQNPDYSRLLHVQSNKHVTIVILPEICFPTCVLYSNNFRKDWLESSYKDFSICCTNIYTVFQFLCNFQMDGWRISYILQVLETNNKLNIVAHEYYSSLLVEEEI